MKWIKGFVGMWVWVSLWVTIIAAGSNLLPLMVNGLLMELLIMTGISVGAAVIATKAMAFITMFVSLVLKSFEEYRQQRN